MSGQGLWLGERPLPIKAVKAASLIASVCGPWLLDIRVIYVVWLTVGVAAFGLLTTLLLRR